MNDHEFEQAAARESGGGLPREFWYLLVQTRKWWLAPLLALLLLLGLVMWMSATAAAPFIYTLF